jgi:glycosyltransferase involved in cell wall biosynthesis
MSRPLLSVIIPSYNRPQHLAALLDSILEQSFDDWEVVIGEDHAPARDQVRVIAEDYSKRTGGRITCHLNEETLGYDRNFRRLIELARGRFVFVMGDDDLVERGAFAAVASAIARHPNVGLILRATAYFVDTPDKVVQVTRYYPRECVFPAGKKAIVACFRRLVGMSGIVMDRDLAHASASARWDGSLFYQHWIAGNILVERDAVYIPDILVKFRRFSPRAFGTAAAERGLYTPGAEPTDTSLKGVRFQLEIARAIGEERGVEILPEIQRDYANYIFPTFQTQAGARWPEFYKLYRDLGQLGLGRFLPFHLWFWAIVVFGARNIDAVLRAIRRWIGHTPNISRFALPERVSPSG